MTYGTEAISHDPAAPKSIFGLSAKWAEQHEAADEKSKYATIRSVVLPIDAQRSRDA